MDLRLRTLEHLDSRAVPLPHGTEVVTRVDRIAGERRVPQGSVGRVTKTDGDALEVAIVGVGVLTYARAEVSPRRVGQALFARRRADTWAALHSCVVLETTVGSHAWGLADERSDVDRRGIFAFVGRFADNRMVQSRAQTVNVAPRRILFLLHFLRRDVIRRAPQFVGTPLRRHRRDAEIHQFRLHFRIEEDVFRFNVAVEEAGGFGGFEAFGDF